MLNATTPIEKFLTDTAARTPTPGGGSVAALVGALAAAIGEMAVNYSLGKKDLAPHETLFHETAKELKSARETLLQMMLEDQQAFAALSAARKLPADSPEHLAAARACSLGPQIVAATALAVLELCDRVADVANQNLLSDLAVAAELAMATIRTASYNMRVNLPGMNDQAMRDALAAQTQNRIERARDILVRLMPRLWARIESA